MAEPQPLPTQGQLDRAAQIAAAEAKQKSREAGIRAQAIGEGRTLERNELLTKLGVRTIDDIGLLAEVRKEHTKELTSLQLHFGDAIRHIRGGAFWRGVGAMGVVTVLLCAATGYGVSFFLAESQMNAVAITQAATRPSAEAMRNAMQPQEGGGFQ